MMPVLSHLDHHTCQCLACPQQVLNKYHRVAFEKELIDRLFQWVMEPRVTLMSPESQPRER